MDVPSSGKGISAELNLEESTVVPSIYTSDIYAVLGRIRKSGETILKSKTSIGEQAKQGHFALFEDTSENRMCLYSEGGALLDDLVRSLSLESHVLMITSTEICFSSTRSLFHKLFILRMKFVER